MSGTRNETHERLDMDYNIFPEEYNMGSSERLLLATVKFQWAFFVLENLIPFPK
jgi:hypothetical protein